jgi:hypothetical protein
VKAWMRIGVLVVLAVAATKATAAVAAVAVAATTAPTAAPTTAPTTAESSAAALPTPDVTISIGEEENRKVVRALVKLQDKPLENAAVTISVKRTFGLLPLGKDTTLDDGTAAAPFPADLPGGADGQLHFVAEVAGAAQYRAALAEAAAASTTARAERQDPFPRALWAPRAPLQLLIPIFVLLGGVWVTYAFVVGQMIAIWRGAKR